MNHSSYPTSRSVQGSKWEEKKRKLEADAFLTQGKREPNDTRGMIPRQSCKLSLTVLLRNRGATVHRW
jgi:hypothetical protein